MVLQFQELERKLGALPAAEQVERIEHFLEELEVQGSGANVAASWIAGREPSQEGIVATIEQLCQFREGNILGDEHSLRDLIDEGRRA